MELFLIGVIFGIIFNPLIMRIVVMFKSKKQLPRHEFGFGYNVTSAKK